MDGFFKTTHVNSSKKVEPQKKTKIIKTIPPKKPAGAGKGSSFVSNGNSSRKRFTVVADDDDKDYQFD